MKGEAQHWFIVFVAFLTQALTFGFAGCMGVFYVEWKKAFAGDLPGDGSSTLGWLTSSVLGVMLSSGPLAGALTHHFGVRPVVMGGALLSTMGLLISSFAESVYLLFFTVPFMIGVGCGLCYAASVTIITQYFHKHFALASGITSTGVSVGALILPMVIQALVNYNTWRNAISVVAGIQAQVMICGALMKPQKAQRTKKEKGAAVEQHEADRIGPPEKTVYTKISDTDNVNIDRPTVVPNGGDSTTAPPRSGFMVTLDSLGISLIWTNRVYACILPMFFCCGGAFATTVVYIKERAKEVGVPDFQSALLISIFGLSGFFARAGNGYFLDAKIFHPITLYCFANFLVALTLPIIAVSEHYAVYVICVFAIGFGAGLYVAINIVIVRHVVGVHRFPGGMGLALFAVAVSMMSTVALAGYLLDTTGDYLAGFLFASLQQGSCGAIALINHLVWTRWVKDSRWPPPLPSACRKGYQDGQPPEGA